MVVVAQLVRASVCGTEGRGFEPHLPPKRMKPDEECHPALLVIMPSRFGYNLAIATGPSSKQLHQFSS